MNGSLLLISHDRFRTLRPAVVSRREAARSLGEGSVFVSFSGDGAEALKDPARSGRTAALAADVASEKGAEVCVLAAGAYWGAYWPVLAALQSQAETALPLEGCLLRCDKDAAKAPPPYLRLAAQVNRRAWPPRATAAC